MIARLFRRFVVWAVRRNARRMHGKQRIIAFESRNERRSERIVGFYRFAFWRFDEWVDSAGKLWHALPWYCPVNAFVHCWRPAPGYAEEMHDHPRWSITLCLRGRLIERTPWGERELRPGSIVIRSRKAIHGFTIPPEHRGKTWTLFIVGRRKHPQNTYVITPRGRR
jgi:hypothetical protein